MMKTMILAGGYATRLYPLTQDFPKPLLPIAGRPMIDHILQDGALPDRPIVSTNRRFVAAFEDWRRDSGADVDLVVEETLCEREKLGTIGAIAYVIETCGLDDDLLIIAGDNLFGFPIERLLNAYRGRPTIALHDIGSLASVRRRYGVAVVEDGRIVAFQEKPENPKSALVSTACYIYPRKILPEFRTFFALSQEGKDAPGYFNEWLLGERGVSIDPFVFDEFWFDIGDRASYIAAHQNMTGEDSWVAESAIIDGCEIRDSVILDRATVSSSRLRGCIVAEDSVLDGVDLQDYLVGRTSRIAVSR